MEKNSKRKEAIAIVGIGCRFPGNIDGPDSFWKALSEKVDAISEVPDDRWSKNKYYSKDPNKRSQKVTKWGGFLDQIDQFDAKFFGVSPREAGLLDPQQRLLMEVSWEALEDSGQQIDELKGSKTGVFMGGFTLDYKLLQFTENNRHLIDAHTATGSMMTLLANRLSHVFDFRGPSMAIDTACSSSLIAVHLACQSIWRKESALALAGGVNIMLKPEYTIAESKAGMLSPTGRSKAFDSRADGYVRGEGAGVVVLKPLSKAIADGDDIYATILGTAANQDGQTQGITVPRQESQEALMKEAMLQADVQSHDIQYVEAHGTGTPIGDPIEANALGTVLSEGRSDDQPCYIGSVKTNFGHTEAAAGIAGLIKTALSLKHQKIPAHLHVKQLNPEIPLDDLKLKIPKELVDWPKTNGAKRAGVNSFGFGGANAHAILEEPPIFKANDDPTHYTNDRAYLIPLSARNAQSLHDFSSRYKAQLHHRNNGNLNTIYDIGYSLSFRRSHHPYRMGIIAHSMQAFDEKLQNFLNDESSPGLVYPSSEVNIQSYHDFKDGSPLVFVFAGMGPQWWGMGRQLFNQEPVFKKAIETCDQVFQSYSGWSILDEMLRDEESSRMHETEISQPANFVLQVGLAKLWESWGIEPGAIIGHSAGEIAAAHVSGALSLNEATKVIYHRSRLQQTTTGLGRLMAVGLSLEEGKELIRGNEDSVSIAAVNSPESITLVGEEEVMKSIHHTLEEEEVFARFLRGSVPYHSHYMESFKDEFHSVLSDLTVNQAIIPLYSTVTGTRIDGTEMGSSYWWKNVRDPVYFSEAIEALGHDGYEHFVELSPHPVLIHSISECTKASRRVILHSLRRKEDERMEMLTNLATLYTLGYTVNWQAMYDQSGKFVKYPSYPWQRERHWNESLLSEKDRLGVKGHPLLGQRLNIPEISWEIILDLDHLPYLRDHQIQGSVVYPGAGYVEMALAAAKELSSDLVSTRSVDNIEFHRALFIPDSDTIIMRLTMNPTDSTFKIYSSSHVQDQWELHATGKFMTNYSPVQDREELSNIKSRCTHKYSAEECYSYFKELGLEYGITFQGIQELWQADHEALASVEIPEDVLPEVDQYSIHPTLLDLCFQTLAAALPFSNGKADKVYMPTGVKTGTLQGKVTEFMYIHAKVHDKTDDKLRGDICLFNSDGQVILEIKDCHAKSLQTDQDQQTSITKEQKFYELSWIKQESEEVIHPRVNEYDSTLTGQWIVFAHDQELSQNLRDLLSKQLGPCTVVYPGSDFGALEDNSSYTINPMNLSHFDKLLDGIIGDGQEISGFIHLWALDAPLTTDLSMDNIEHAEETTSLSILHLVQAINNYEWATTTPKLWVVTRGAQRVKDQAEPIEVIQAPLWGLGKVIGHQEHINIWGGMIDLDPHPQLSTNEANMILNELISIDKEDQIAFRNEERHVARLIEREDLKTSMPISFRPDGSYLITGGFGGLGINVAKWLAKRGARSVILMSRRKMPQRSKWGMLPKDDKNYENIEHIKELERLGLTVHLASVDVADEHSLARFIEDYELEGWPSIVGVIHAAGSAHPRLMMEMDAKEFISVTTPKIKGALNLHNQFKHRSLEIFVMFSSIASVVVSAGQANYSAGNSFMDALAHYRQSLGLPALSINWGPWGETGMATQLDLIEYFVHRGFYPMTTSQGMDALSTLLAQPIPQVSVLGADWPTVANVNYPLGKAPSMLLGLVAEAEEQSGESITQDNEEDILQEMINREGKEDRIAYLQSFVIRLVADTLRVDQQKLDAELSLSSLGLDSMMAIELKNGIESKLNVNIAVVHLLKGPSVSELAIYIFDQLEDQLADYDEETLDVIKDIEQYSEEEIMKLLEEAASDREGIK